MADAREWLGWLAAGRPPAGERRPSPPPPALRGAPPQRRAGSPEPTAEQVESVDAKRSGEHLVLQAGAGTGKTTTLLLIARSDRRRGRYLAFNRPVVNDARSKFPPNICCDTGHSLARKSVGHLYRARIGTPREPAWKAGLRLGIAENMQVRFGERLLTHKGISSAVLRTLKRFCHSADRELAPHHVPQLRGIDQAQHPVLAQLVLPYARRAWQDVQDPNGTAVRFEHDYYLKIWALQEPRISADFLLLDEAQDTNPVLEEVILAQSDHVQVILVGDSAQAIYGWRGARDIMTDFPGRQLTLSQSFRFGPAIAEEANRWLTLVDAPLRLRGTSTIASSIGPLARCDAVLCRSNAGAIQEILQLLSEGVRVALVGGGKPLKALAEAAAALKAGRRTSHHELVLFSSWGELQEYASDDPGGRDLLPLVEIIDEYGVDVVLDAVGRLHAEEDAEVTVSTAHRSKGREWPTVRISMDFEPTPTTAQAAEGAASPGIDIDEARLAYVAVTRARRHLDLGGLGWINHHPDGAVGTAVTDAAAAVPAALAAQPSPWDRLGPLPGGA
ncbi:DNA helicase [Streptomyces sp. CC53]|nr:DNA helicase [Streptomyces sp. CC53]